MKPEIGTKWRHSNGNIYTVLLLANAESQREEYPVTVIYQGENGNIWAKTLADFVAKMRETKND